MYLSSNDDVIGYYIMRFGNLCAIYGFGEYVAIDITAEQAIADVWQLWLELQDCEVSK
jgi:hypothetical protein